MTADVAPQRERPARRRMARLSVRDRIVVPLMIGIPLPAVVAIPTIFVFGVLRQCIGGLTLGAHRG
ncbi:hypothetical protein Gocc_1118 [Gaiella occulta]|uniref:Uncharacterized protein n=1 Tax=Gaiella occulta TaxID=1002870 RepID=A0A7M2YZ06_9ACTN|nr:hypothetical protein [Gaiella occulta]RDI75320.1 hypothetical protein Gocc_1118 [Gaiella occulta]